MRVLNILILSHYFYPAIGGIETVTELLATNFTETGHQVHVMTWSLDSTNKVFPFTVIRNPGVSTMFREHVWADVVLENNPSLRLSWPNLFVRRPLVIGLQTWIIQNSGKIGWAEQLKLKWLKRAHSIIACSDAIRKACFTNSIVIPNPYDDTVFRLMPTIARMKDYVFLGRLVSDKGADIALKAFQRFVTAINGDYESESTLTIIGDGPEYSSLQTLAQNLGVNDRVNCMGSMTGEALASCLNQHRYLLVPSIWEEPYGIVALEGMACGCLPIVSDGGGLPEAVGAAGLIVKRGDINDLATGMLTLVNTPGLEAQLRRAAHPHLIAHQYKSTAKRYLDLLEQAASYGRV